MKKFAIALLISAFFFASTTFADTENVIGMYAHSDGTGNQIFVEINTPFNIYLILKNPSSTSDIIAWDCFINYPDVSVGGNVVVTGWTIAGGGTNLATEPEFQVATLDVPPLPNSDNMILMTAQAYVTTLDEALVYIEGSTLDPLGIGQPTYCPEDWGGDPANLVAMIQSSGFPDIPVLIINRVGLPVSPDSWGMIKALLR